MAAFQSDSPQRFTPLLTVQVPRLFHGLEIVGEVGPRFVSQRESDIVPTVVQDDDVGMIIDYREYKLSDRLARHAGLNACVDHLDVPPRIAALQQDLQRSGQSRFKRAG